MNSQGVPSELGTPGEYFNAGIHDLHASVVRSTRRKTFTEEVARLAVCLLFAFCLGLVVHGATPLTTLEYHINGTGLQVTPAAVSVPKGCLLYTSDAADE